MTQRGNDDDDDFATSVEAVTKLVWIASLRKDAVELSNLLHRCSRDVGSRVVASALNQTMLEITWQDRHIAGAGEVGAGRGPRSLLHTFVSQLLVDVVRVLASFGANPNLYDSAGESAVTAAFKVHLNDSGQQANAAASSAKGAKVRELLTILAEAAVDYTEMQQTVTSSSSETRMESRTSLQLSSIAAQRFRIVCDAFDDDLWPEMEFLLTTLLAEHSNNDDGAQQQQAWDDVIPCGVHTVVTGVLSWNRLDVLDRVLSLHPDLSKGDDPLMYVLRNCEDGAIGSRLLKRALTMLVDAGADPQRKQTQLCPREESWEATAVGFAVAHYEPDVVEALLYRCSTDAETTEAQRLSSASRLFRVRDCSALTDMMVECVYRDSSAMFRALLYGFDVDLSFWNAAVLEPPLCALSSAVHGDAGVAVIDDDDRASSAFILQEAASHVARCVLWECAL